MNYDKYLIKKGKLDLVSSLKALGKKRLNEKFKEFDVKNVYELRDYILDDFETYLNEFKADDSTKHYFEVLLRYENTRYIVADYEDIASLLVFVYNNGNYTAYYIPIEVQEIIIKFLGGTNLEEKFNLEHAPNKPIIKNLKELLNTLTVKDLNNIGRLLCINRLSNKTKKELVKIVYNSLTDKDKLTDLIERFIDKEFNLLKDIIKNNGTIQDNNISFRVYHFLSVAGLVFIFRRKNKFYISMTDDVYNVIKTIDFKKVQKIVDENTKVYNLVRSMVELYGVVSYNYLDYYYSLYYGNGKELDAPNNALLFCDRIDNINITYVDHNMYFVHYTLKYENLKKLLDDIISRQKTIIRKPIKLKELLKYSDYNYYEESEAKNKFKKYLKKKNIQSDDIEIIIRVISNIYRFGNSYIKSSIDILQNCGVKVAGKNLQEILNYLMEIYNNSRIWSNNGWTPIEMKKKWQINI